MHKIYYKRIYEFENGRYIPMLIDENISDDEGFELVDDCAENPLDVI
jgi:hypothetical protein